MENEALDIYFQDEYGKLYEKSDCGNAEIFLFTCPHGRVKHQFIKREIPYQIRKSEKKWYDIITPYGYGGPLVTECKLGEKEKLISGFEQAFSKYCLEQNIVSEFVRFHPVANNASDFDSMYHPIWDRNTLGTNLRDYEDPVQSEFSKRCRKNIRQAINKGVTYQIKYQPEDLSSFQEVYYATMKRNEASDYYYFDEAYFTDMLRYFGKQLLLIEAIYEKKVIAAGLYFLSNKTIHIHLSGTLQEYLFLSPAYILRYALTIWGKQHGYELIHHGGGRSNKEDDALFMFKQQFAMNTKLDFYIGKKIWNKEVYNEICEKNSISTEISFFPAYRFQ